jgi:hypothetical protein
MARWHGMEHDYEKTMKQAFYGLSTIPTMQQEKKQRTNRSPCKRCSDFSEEHRYDKGLVSPAKLRPPQVVAPKD